METIVLGKVSPDGVASNSLSATERELVTTTTTGDVTFFSDFFRSFFCAFVTGAAARGTLAPGANAAVPAGAGIGAAVRAEAAPAINAAPLIDATKAND